MAEVAKETDQWLFINDWPGRRYSIFVLTSIVLLSCFIAFRYFSGDGSITALCGLCLLLPIVLIPGSSILRILRFHGLGFIRSLFFSFALGLGFIMLLGFILNLFHYAGIIMEPLRMMPIFIGYTISVIGLLLLVRYRDKSYSAPKMIWNWGEQPIIIWIIAILLPFAVTVAAARVNIIGDYTLMFWLVLLMCLVPLTVFGKSRSYAPMVLSVSIALLLHRALITNYIMGYDVFSEYSASYITITNGWWNISQSLGIYGGSANTALSIVTLAPVLTNMTGIGTVEMLKIVYPLLFSIVPLGIYKLADDQFGPRAAFLGVGAFVGYQVFFGLMLQLGKQEIAEIFLVAFLLALTQPSMCRGKKFLLMVPFLSGIIVSHYGIGILLILLMIIAIALQCISHVINHVIHWRDGWKGPLSWIWTTIRTWMCGQLRFRAINVGLLIFAGAVYLIWYAHTGSGLVLAYIGLSEVTSSTGAVANASSLTIRNYEALEYVFINFGSNVNNLDKYFVVFSQLITSAGLIWAFADAKVRSRLNDDYLYFALAAGIFLVMSYFLPNLAGNFYFGRIFTFTSIFLCGFFCIGVLAILNPFRKILEGVKLRIKLPSIKMERIVTVASCLFIIGLLGTNTGAIPWMTDDFVGSIALKDSTSWSVYSDSDVVTAKWISEDHIGNGVPVADWHRFPIFGGLAMPVDILRYQFTNSSLDTYVYLSEWNNRFGYVYPLNSTKGSTITYCPLTNVTKQVGNQYDIVYSTSKLSSVIYIPEKPINQNPPGPYIYTYHDAPIYVFGAFFGIMLMAILLAIITTKLRKERGGK